MEEFEDELHWVRLARYLAGEATEGEKAEVERWAASDESSAAELTELRRLWRAAHSPCAARVDAMWEAISRRIHQPE